MWRAMVLALRKRGVDILTALDVEVTNEPVLSWPNNISQWASK